LISDIPEVSFLTDGRRILKFCCHGLKIHQVDKASHKLNIEAMQFGFLSSVVQLSRESIAGLHNSESWKGQIDQHKLSAGRKSLFC